MMRAFAILSDGSFENWCRLLDDGVLQRSFEPVDEMFEADERLRGLRVSPIHHTNACQSYRLPR